MFKSILKIAASTALVVGIHSVLASKAAKKKASELFGERTRNGLYRPLYNGLAIATFGALGLYALRACLEIQERSAETVKLFLQ